MKPGRSFKFGAITGAKDPDEVLREQGPLALKSQLAQTRPFVEVLFARERDLEPLDTPERQSGLKARLRRIASAISDKDLSEQYRQYLFDKFYNLRGRKPFRYDGSSFDITTSLRRALGKTQFELLQERIRTFEAAIAFAAVQHPNWAAPFVERIVNFGFGDRRLDALVQPLLDALFDERYESEVVVKNIKSDGQNFKLEEACKFATEVDAYPFVNSIDEGVVRSMWEAGFAVISELAHIEAELEERRNALKARQPILDDSAFVERGRWLRLHQRELANTIHSGELWARASAGEEAKGA